MKTAIVSASRAEAAMLGGLLRAVPSDITWVETDARAAMARCKAEPPDVLLVLVGPSIDGVRIVQEVMAARPCAIVLLSTDLSRDVHEVYAALAAGAVDAETLPRSFGLGAKASDPKAAANEESRLVAKLRRLGSRRPSPRARRRRAEPVLAIGASTGGPDALSRVLARLPSGLSAPVLLAQHIDEEFLPGLADYLSGRAGRRVEVAVEGALLESGKILIVRSGLQATVDAASRVRYHPPAPGNPFLPCIDTLFHSLARAADTRGVAALLTGMGADGAAGLLSLRRAGWITFAQDAESSVVFGMPKAAADLGAATQVMPLDEIARAATGALAKLGRELAP